MVLRGKSLPACVGLGQRGPHLAWNTEVLPGMRKIHHWMLIPGMRQIG